MFDKIVPNVPSDEYERAKTTAYTTWERQCRTLFGNVRAEIVSSDCFPHMYVVQKGCLTPYSIISAANISQSDG